VAVACRALGPRIASFPIHFAPVEGAKVLANAPQTVTYCALFLFPLRARLRSFSRIEGLVGSASEDHRKGYARESSERPHDAKIQPLMFGDNANSAFARPRAATAIRKYLLGLFQLFDDCRAVQILMCSTHSAYHRRLGSRSSRQ
jgi:hypothetical protein